MGWLIQFGGGWENPAGYIYAFFTMAGCALLGMLLQLMTTDKTPRKAALTQENVEDCYRAGFCLKVAVARRPLAQR